MLNSAALAFALAVLAAAALGRRHQERALADRDATTYRAGYLDGLHDVHRGLLDTPPDTTERDQQ